MRTRNHLHLLLPQAVEEFTKEKARLIDFIAGEEMGAAEGVIAEIQKLVKMAATTEFEFKSMRHAIRSRKKKQAILDRAGEFLTQTRKDWKCEAHPLVVKFLEDIIAKGV
jgi:hypothetical protein